jgi:putative ABC transport system permease protein
MSAFVDGCDTAVPKDLAVGKKITLDGDATISIQRFSVTEFTIVGIVETPAFISFERGATTVWLRQAWRVISFPEGAFCTDYYTNIFVTQGQ